MSRTAVEKTLEESVEEESFEETLITATVVAVVLIILLTIIIVVWILCKTPPRPNQEGGRSNSLKKRVIDRVQDIYHKYWNVQDKDAPKGITIAGLPKAPMNMQGSIHTEKAAKEILLNADKDGVDYYRLSTTN